MNLKSKAVSTKNFVVKHKVAIAITITSAFWVKVNMSSLEQHNDFLKEHGLYEEFYTITEAVMGE